VPGMPCVVVEGSAHPGRRGGSRIYASPACRGHCPADCTLMPGLMDVHCTPQPITSLLQESPGGPFRNHPALQMFNTLLHAQMCFEMGFTTQEIILGDRVRRSQHGGAWWPIRDAIQGGIMAGPRS